MTVEFHSSTWLFDYHNVLSHNDMKALRWQHGTFDAQNANELSLKAIEWSTFRSIKLGVTVKHRLHSCSKLKVSILTTVLYHYLVEKFANSRQAVQYILSNSSGMWARTGYLKYSILSVCYWCQGHTAGETVSIITETGMKGFSCHTDAT